jgi:hypothetical protein
MSKAHLERLGEPWNLTAVDTAKLNNPVEIIITNQQGDTLFMTFTDGDFTVPGWINVSEANPKTMEIIDYYRPRLELGNHYIKIYHRANLLKGLLVNPIGAAKPLRNELKTYLPSGFYFLKFQYNLPTLGVYTYNFYILILNKQPVFVSSISDQTLSNITSKDFKSSNLDKKTFSMKANIEQSCYISNLSNTMIIVRDPSGHYHNLASKLHYFLRDSFIVIPLFEKDTIITTPDTVWYLTFLKQSLKPNLFDSNFVSTFQILPVVLVSLIENFPGNCPYCEDFWSDIISTPGIVNYDPNQSIKSVVNFHILTWPFDPDSLIYLIRDYDEEGFIRRFFADLNLTIYTFPDLLYILINAMLGCSVLKGLGFTEDGLNLIPDDLKNELVPNLSLSIDISTEIGYSSFEEKMLRHLLYIAFTKLPLFDYEDR